MSDSTVFLIGVSTTLLASIAVVAYLRAPLQKILEDLCGTAERARFWSAFSVVVLALFPLVFVLNEGGEKEFRLAPVFQLGRMVREGIWGLVVAVLALGVVLSLFIARSGRRVPVATEVRT